MELWKKQKKILTGFAAFLIFMFLCTLISRSVYASRLPRVTAETPRRMAVSHIVEADGIVHQGREYAVTALTGLRVRTVYVQIGDRVTPETLLFDLDLEELEAQIQKKDLEIRKLELQIASMEQNRNLDTQKWQTENARAQEDYARAEQKAGEALERAREDLDNAQDVYDDHKEHSVQRTSDEDRRVAQTAWEEWTENETRLCREMEQAKEAYEKAQEEVKRLEEEAKMLQSPEDDGTTASGSGEEDNSKQQETGDNPSSSASGDGADIKTEGKEEPEEESEEEEMAELQLAREAEKKAKEAYDAAAEAYETHMAHAVEKPDFSTEDAEQSAWEEKKESLGNAVDAAERAVQDAERSQSDMMLDVGRKVADSSVPSDADSSLEVSRLELAALQTELAAYRKVQDASGQVYPEAEGVITRIQVSPGERVGDGAAIVYADLSSPMQFQVSLTKEQKKYVNQGETVKLKLGNASYKELTVDYVAENEMNPELHDVRIFLPDGTGTIGQSGSFRAEAQSETFSCCIPLNALHEDSSQRKFVYIVSERSGILGTELVSEQVYVKVLDQNDSYAAIEEGVIDRETEVIIDSTDELEDQKAARYQE